MVRVCFDYLEHKTRPQLAFSSFPNPNENPKDKTLSQDLIALIRLHCLDCSILVLTLTVKHEDFFEP